GGPAAFLITTPYSLCVCPEGQNVTLTCRISGPLTDRHNLLYKSWLPALWAAFLLASKGFIGALTSPLIFRRLKKDLKASSSNEGLWTKSETDASELIFSTGNARKPSPARSGSPVCEGAKLHQVWGNTSLALWFCYGLRKLPSSVADITAAALATGACIVGILCLPLILVLIYKQRQAISNRRILHPSHLLLFHSSAQGIENPVFEAVPSASMEPRPRPQLSYMASRQPSKSGRHLLSEPGTPLSPPGPGDCFFPTLDPVPDSPNSLKD
ncbi:VISTA protein, partial [Columbina picui]|nr:VISTA protein [Columbina picui]